MHCHKRVISVFLKLSSLSLYFRLRMAQPFFVHSPQLGSVSYTQIPSRGFVMSVSLL